ncbi:MAG TPA: ABC transporter substrate-binding protein [Stellaceae bacterium]|nr:ABC transporter substrate-binding protein [Stellaceae bacterium]
MPKRSLALVLVIAACALTAVPAGAESIKIGAVKTGATGVVFVALEKGYFTDEGVPAELVYFESAQPIAVAAASGAIDFGVTAPTGGLYSLAGQGTVRVIAGGIQETAGFKGAAYLVSARAYEAGLHTLNDFAGHSFAVSQVGSPPHYALGLLADKYGFDVKSMHILPLQSIPNIASAVAGGQADATILTQSPALLPIVERGDIKRIGWVGDETPWQFNLAFTSTRTADERADVVARFLRAYRRGARLYHDAFTGPDGREAEEQGAPELLAIMGKYLGQTVAEVRLGIGYFDADARLDVPDVLHQIEWYKTQGMLKGEIDGNAVIDKRYVMPLPRH